MMSLWDALRMNMMISYQELVRTFPNAKQISEETMGILSWIIFGLIAGILAKWIMPGKDGGGFFMTILLGIVGAVVGGWISTLFGFGKVDGFNFGSFVVAVIGAIVVLFIYRKIKS